MHTASNDATPAPSDTVTLHLRADMLDYLTGLVRAEQRKKQKQDTHMARKPGQPLADYERRAENARRRLAYVSDLLRTLRAQTPTPTQDGAR